MNIIEALEIVADLARERFRDGAIEGTQGAHRAMAMVEVVIAAGEEFFTAHQLKRIDDAMWFLEEGMDE